MRPASLQETLHIGLFATVAGFVSLLISASHGYMLLYGDAVAHLGIARRILDTRYPGLLQLGGVWLPLPHLLMLPFVWKMEWWQNGMAGASPSLIFYVLGVMGFFRLARRILSPAWALAGTAFLGLNPNLLYLATTPMTEPLFLALLLWIVHLTVDLVEALQQDRAAGAVSRMIVLGMLIVAAVLTRYDGWILGAAVWCVVASTLLRRPAMRARLMPAFLLFTLLAVAGPVSWLAYNQHYMHDWLDFLRGPYSAREIDRKTSPPGTGHYPGWHAPVRSLLLYARTAQVDAAWWEMGWLVTMGAVGGLIVRVRAKTCWPALLLWLPLPFYVYSISFGSVPIFIPELPPHSFYNSRYGMEMLPAFALFGAAGAEWLARRWKARYPLPVRLMQPAALMLCAVNTVLMAHATPLVLQEAMRNSRGRLAIEGAVAAQLAEVPASVPIMIDEGKYVGALQRAGVRLRRAVSPEDYYFGRTLPSEKAAYVVAGDGDGVAQAVAAHPEGLTPLTIICSTGEACVRIFRSERFAAGR